MGKYNTFIKRVLALFVDAAILWPIDVLATALSGGDHKGLYSVAGMVVYLLLTGMYYIILTARFGATLGKRVFGLRVVRADGEESVTYAEVVVRYLPFLIFGAIGIPITYLIGACGVRIENFCFLAAVGYFALVNVWAIAEVCVLALNEKRRSIHDLMAGTVVVNARCLN